jgi:hypothetical protein
MSLAQFQRALDRAGGLLLLLVGLTAAGGLAIIQL